LKYEGVTGVEGAYGLRCASFSCRGVDAMVRTKRTKVATVARPDENCAKHKQAAPTYTFRDARVHASTQLRRNHQCPKALIAFALSVMNWICGGPIDCMTTTHAVGKPFFFMYQQRTDSTSLLPTIFRNPAGRTNSYRNLFS